MKGWKRLTWALSGVVVLLNFYLMYSWQEDYWYAELCEVVLTPIWWAEIINPVVDVVGFIAALMIMVIVVPVIAVWIVYFVVRWVARGFIEIRDPAERTAVPSEETGNK